MIKIKYSYENIELITVTSAKIKYNTSNVNRRFGDQTKRNSLKYGERLNKQ